MLDRMLAFEIITLNDENLEPILQRTKHLN